MYDLQNCFVFFFVIKDQLIVI